jgi:nucleoside-diphosphate-sugar epimerase
MGKSQSADITKARQRLGFAPKTQVSEGVKYGLEWWRSEQTRTNKR